LHHQYLPDEIQFEPGTFAPQQQQALQSMGHNLRELDRRYGNMQAIYLDYASDRLEAASDPRGVGAARVELPDAAVQR
jgi:gamma-glutamyltranspeptidase/glutathione hydrolase